MTDNKITVPAAKVAQGDLVLYTTSLKVGVLISPGFYDVEVLDPSNPLDKGYQRVLNEARARKFAGYIVQGQEEGQDAFLPTSVLLATDQEISFDADRNTVTIDKSVVCPFSVVDGQHRLEGLKMAAEKNEDVRHFEVPINIAHQLPRLHQMCHFLIVNTTQKSVDKSVEQTIINRLSKAIDIEDTPSLPKWIANTVRKGDVAKAHEYVEYLNSDEKSPWRGRINMANEKNSALIMQGSFVKSIVSSVLSASNPLQEMARRDVDREKKIFLNYWQAITNLLVKEDLSAEDASAEDASAEGTSAKTGSVIYKTNGVELFCRFSTAFFMKLQNEGANYRVDKMEGLLKRCFENMEGEYAGAGQPSFWIIGSNASALNKAALHKVHNEMMRALNADSSEEEIQL